MWVGYLVSRVITKMGSPQDDSVKIIITITTTTTIIIIIIIGNLQSTFGIPSKKKICNFYNLKKRKEKLCKYP